MEAVAIITRKSSRDEQKVSVTRQEAMGREWAKAHHPDRPVTVFSDNAVSGVEMDRSGWVAFTEAVKAGRVHTVWAYEQSRLTRAGVTTWDETCSLLSAAGIRAVHTDRQGAISVVEGDRIHGRITSVMDQHEREQIIVRTRDGLRHLASLGKPAGPTGYGYARSYGPDGKPVLNPDEAQAAIVREMVRSVAEGESLGVVAARLNARKVPTPRGGREWNRMSVRLIVTAPRIVGDRVHQGKVIGPAEWPPIVDRAIWDQARAQLSLNRPGRTASNRRRYLLTGGLATCALCGTNLISSTTPLRGSLVASYACPHPSRPDGGCGHVSILAERLEGHVSGIVEEWISDDLAATELARHYASTTPERGPLRDELARLEERLVIEAERWATGDMLEIEHTAARGALLDRRQTVLDALHELGPAPTLVTAEEIRVAWRRGDNATRRPLIRTLAKEISVRRAFHDGHRLPIADRVTVRPIWD